MRRFHSFLVRTSTRTLRAFASHFFPTEGTTLLVSGAAPLTRCYDHGRVRMVPPSVETVPRLVLLNVMLQTFDGLATYYGLSLGVQEGNPVMRAAMMHWGVAETLLGTKGVACLMLPFFLLLRHRRLSVWALALIAGVYLTLSFVPWLTILLTEARRIWA